MPHRRPSPEHQEAVARRLALLSAELAAARPEDAEADWTEGHTRIRPFPPVPELDREEPPEIPVPGRHASRRAGRAMVRMIPGPLRGRVALGPAQLTVVALLVALGLAVTAWWVVRADAEPAPVVDTPSGALVSAGPLSDASPVAGPAASAASPSAGSVPGPPSEAAASASAQAGTVTVDVAGKVRRPGIAVLDSGARVVDALEAAGGARSGVDLTGLNLARLLVDGEQILVGRPAPAGAAASALATPGAPGAPLVNLNTASQTELEALPEVGPVTAQAILSWRDEHGGFTAVDELLEVDGIGDATLDQLAPYVTV